MDWISEATKPKAWKQVLLAFGGDEYTTGHWSPRANDGAGAWIGFAANQSPPYYVIEAGSVTHYIIIEPSPKETK